MEFCAQVFSFPPLWISYISSFLSLDAKFKEAFPKTNLPHLTILGKQSLPEQHPSYRTAL